MTTHKEALKLALEALEREARGYAVHDELQIPRSMRDAITAIKEALTQPEQEPFDVCVMVGHSKEHGAYFVYEETAPQEFCAIKGPFATRSEAEKAMRDPNAPLIQQPKEPEQEPVAYGMWDTMIGCGGRMMYVRLDKGQDGCTVPLYTIPPQRKLLTDEQWMIEMVDAAMVATRDIVPRITRSQCRLIIEAAHGIKG